MERLPCGDFGANAVFFRIGALAYNVFVLFKRLALSEMWRKHQVQTIRWRLYQAAGKVVRHAGQVFLKSCPVMTLNGVSASAYAILEEVRARCRKLAFSS